ncbi:hypothetical protein [Escherichia phage vB_EcoM_EP57]|nr:hypothetical protein [Escherichia phage vB_EcoM_EP57]
MSTTITNLPETSKVNGLERCRHVCYDRHVYLFRNRKRNS